MKKQSPHSTFEDLEVYQLAREFRKIMYRVANRLPCVCEDEQYLPVEEIASLKQQGWRLRRLIDGDIRYLRDQKNSEGSPSVRESSRAYDIDELDNDSRISI